jgi:hypothetical protein
MNYNLECHSTANPVSVMDPYYLQTDPETCDDPSAMVGTGGTPFTTTTVINTVDFQFQNLANAVETSFSFIGSDSPANNLHAIALLDQILRYSYPQPISAVDRDILAFAEEGFSEAIGHAFARNEVTEDDFSEGLLGEMALAKGTYDHLIAQASEGRDEFARLNHSLNRAQLYRACGLRHSSLDLLDSLLLWSSGSDSEYVESFRCLVQLELDVLDSLVLREDVPTLIVTCRMQSGIPKHDPKGPESISIYSNQLEVFPNPASGSFTIVFASTQPGTVSCIVTDLTGKIVTQTNQEPLLGNGTGYLTLTASELTPGLYVVELLTGDIRRSAKLVVTR